MPQTAIDTLMAEEEEYLRVLEHNLSVAEQAELIKGLEHAVAEPL